jgi:hypothetical protein
MSIIFYSFLIPHYAQLRDNRNFPLDQNDFREAVLVEASSPDRNRSMLNLIPEGNEYDRQGTSRGEYKPVQRPPPPFGPIAISIQFALTGSWPFDRFRTRGKTPRLPYATELL